MENKYLYVAVHYDCEDPDWAEALCVKNTRKECIDFIKEYFFDIFIDMVYDNYDTEGERREAAKDLLKDIGEGELLDECDVNITELINTL